MAKKTKQSAKPQINIAPLTPREMDVLKLVCEEYSSTEIAKKLLISKHTVDVHRKHILKKTNSRSIVGLMKYALSHGLMN